jgi:hypothetical protein
MSDMPKLEYAKCWYDDTKSYTVTSVESREKHIAEWIKDFYEDLCIHYPELKTMSFNREYNEIMKDLERGK